MKTPKRTPSFLSTCIAALFEAAWRIFALAFLAVTGVSPVSGGPIVPPPATLNISISGSQATVSWSDPNYNLESAYEIVGPWFPVPGAASGYTLAADQAQQFFRLTSQNLNPSLLPAAANYSFSVLHDQPLAVSPPGVLQFDSDPSALPLTAIVADPPRFGTASFAPDGTLFYTPALHFVGIDQFYYIVTDGLNVSTPALITITVTNTAPVALGHLYGVAENSFLTVSAPGVLVNDYDPDGDTISVVTPQLSGPANGTLTLYPNGTFTYIPNANFAGQDSFTYTITDQVTNGNVATVTLNVHSDTAEPPPVAGNSTFSTAHDQNLFVPAPGVLLQCSDPDSDPLSAVLVSGTANGVLSLYADGSLDYLPNTGFIGQDSFTYQVTDSTTNSMIATVTIDVTNTAPVANDDAYTTLPGQTLTVSASGVLANDTDVEGDPLTAQLATGPGDGSLTLCSNGGFVYTPNPAFVGVDSFTYTAFDGFDFSEPATVTITVTNQPPVGVDDVYGVQMNGVLNVSAPGVLENDYDPNGENLSAELLSSPAHGSLTFETNGAFIYQPAANFTGLDTFTYLAEDAQLASKPVTVTLSVHAANTPPVAVADIYVILPDDILTADTYTGVLFNDFDADSDELSAVLINGPANDFDFAFNSDGTFTYIPNVGFAGVDTFTYQAFDGVAYSSTALVTIIVTNSGPMPVSTSYTTHFNTPLSVPEPGVLGFDGDQDDNPLAATLAASPQHGTILLMPDGSFQYTPETGFVGKDEFTYQASDGVTNSPATPVSIIVQNSPPVTSPANYYTQENTPLTTAASVLSTDYDPDYDPLSAVLVSSPAAAASFNFYPDGIFTYVPQAGFTGVDSFTYQAFDGVAYSAVTTAAITVGNTPVAVNDYYIYTPGVPLVVPASNGVLQNDFDASNPGLTAQQVGGTGLVTLNPDGSFTFLSPSSPSSLPITFQYVAILNNVTSAPATVELVSELLAAAPPAGPAAPPPPPPPPPLVLTKVIFFNGNALLPDDGGAGAMPFKAPQWLNQAGDGVINAAKGDHAFPYSYVAGQTMNAAPIFTCNDPTLLTVKDLQIQGLVYDKNISLKITIPCIVIRIPQPALMVVLPSPANTNFSKAANFYNPLTIKWQFSTDGLAANNAKKVWQPCGTSKNQIYITQAAPLTSLLYQTVVEIGSREGAGLTKPTNMLNSVWSYFSKIRVQRASDGSPMYYYRNWSVGNTTVPTLLNVRDGQCTSWCELFKAVVEAQGIPGAAIIRVEGVNAREQFLVKNWTFGVPNPANPLAAQRSVKYPYLNIPRNTAPFLIPAAGQNYVWWSSVVRTAGNPDETFRPDVIDAVDGVPGENNARPAKFFIRHFVVSLNGKYYDPSYGLTYVSVQDLYMKGIAGFAFGGTVFYNGFINDGTAVAAYNKLLNITRIRTAPAGALDPLKAEEVDQKLAFIVQPSDTKQKVAITPAVKVQLQDWNGNPVATAGIPINITLYNVAGADPVAVSGATAMTDATGAATFTTLQVNTPVASCALLAQSTAALDAVSAAFEITP